jgi:hypothetical protein
MRNFISNPISTILIFFILLFVYSLLGPRLPISILTQQKGEPLIVTEEGTATITPDVAKITVGIEESGSVLKTAQDSVSRKSKELIAQLKKLDIAEKDIKTTGYSVYPEYDYNAEPINITGYRVSTNYLITIRDFEKVNDALVVATQAGANVVGNVSFDLADDTREEALQKAREEAVDKAKAKAKSLASAAGISLGKIINISEASNNNLTPSPLYARDAIGLGVAELPVQPEIQPGETEITTSITISWEIK